jgi:dipeptidyl aminopeptidase/acylaminoacyl peptidase
MKVWQTLARHQMSRRAAWVICALLFAFAPLPLLGQAPAAKPAAQAPAAQQAQAAAKETAPLSWADKILQQETYVTPPPELAAAVTAPRQQNITLGNESPDKKWFLNQIGDGPVPMSTFSKPFHELGGLFVDFKANRARPLTVNNGVGLQIVSAVDGTKKMLATPPNARVSNPTWSLDGSAVAYFVHTEDATHIWMTDLATNKARQITPRPVLATLVTSFDFTKDGRQIATVLIPDNRPAMPAPFTVPTGPEVKVHDAKDKNRLRTFPSLMSTPYELQLLEWHSTGQLVLIDAQAPAAVAKGKPAKNASVAGLRKIGQPAMIRALDLSPDGKYIRVTRMTKPFSYIVPVSNFGSVDEIWDADGKVLAQVSDRPLDLGTRDATATDPSEPPAPNANQQGKREVAWRDDGQGLTYLEQDPAPADGAGAAGGRGARAGGRGGAGGGDQAAGAGRGQGPQRKDRLYQWLPPFEEKGAKVLFENSTRMNGVRFSPDMQLIFFRETSGTGATGNTVEVGINLAEPTQRYTLARFRTDDPAANPGTLVGVRRGSGGQRGAGGGQRGATGGSGPVLLSPDKTSVYYQGTVNDKNPEQVGPKTFVDRVAIKGGERKRLFESDNKDVYESVTSVIDPEAGRLIIERQSPTAVPQFFLIDGTTRKQLTDNKDLFPDLTNAPKERVMVTRADGIKFPVYVMLPPGYQKGTRLPAIFWFYPREFTDQEGIDRPDRAFNKNSFQNFGTRSMQFFVRLGYAVVVDTPGAIPIVGPNGQQNNNYVNDLRNGLSAIIDELDRRALIDRERLAIGGHSYGAFTTVNAMVHTPFFKAGIAGDGAYNRTLTPIGFQSERRDLWEAPNVYLGMSPFLYANNLTGALLMYHNLGDQNVGTDPTNSMRMFHALNGLGKTTALYLYPLEDHGPVARETLLDLWARWAAWLDKYVKNPAKPEEGKK